MPKERKRAEPDNGLRDSRGFWTYIGVEPLDFPLPPVTLRTCGEKGRTGRGEG